MNRMTRSEIMEKFHKEVEEGRILVGVGAGTGITAKCSEKGGADMLIIYNSGRFRMAGRGSLSGLLAYGDANKIVQEMGSEVLPVVKNTPVLAGVCGTDPFRVMDLFLKQLKDQGFNGVQNFPTVGLIDGKFRANLEETGMGYGLEVDMVREAHKLDMLTCPYVFDPEQAKAMAEAGADILVAHMGLTTKGSIGAETALTLDDCCVKIREIIKAGREVRQDIMVICHGGPIADPEDAAYVIKHVPEIDGFFGAACDCFVQLIVIGHGFPEMLPLFLLIFGISQQELITFMLEEIKVVFENLGYLNQLVIAGGGGGIPVIRQGNHLKGASAVLHWW